MEECVMNWLKKGTVFVVTSGEYSDYGIVMAMRALRDIGLAELNDQDIPREGKWLRGDELADHLVRSGMAERAVAAEVRLVDDGRDYGFRVTVQPVGWEE
jgi:hypothetical protein